MEPITVQTTYTAEQLLRFQKYHLRKSRVVCAIACAVYTLAIVVITAISLAFDGSLPEYFAMSVIVWAAIVFFSVFVFVIAPASGAKNAAFKNIVCRFTFDEEHIRQSAGSEGVQSESTQDYSTVYRVCETPTNFYVYIAKNQAYVLDKEGFESGTPDALRALLLRKIGTKKYRLQRA